MFKWLHHLISPHCSDCQLEKECKSCDTLRGLLEAERFEKKTILNQLLEMNKPQTEIRYEPVELPKPLKPSNTSWRIKQQELEEADRVKARIMKDREKQVGSEIKIVETKTVEDLEKELGIEEQKDAS